MKCRSAVDVGARQQTSKSCKLDTIHMHCKFVYQFLLAYVLVCLGCPERLFMFCFFLHLKEDSDRCSAPHWTYQTDILCL